MKYLDYNPNRSAVEVQYTLSNSETNYCMRIQNHLFTLVSQEPLSYYESCFQESSSKNIVPLTPKKL